MVHPSDSSPTMGWQMRWLNKAEDLRRCSIHARLSKWRHHLCGSVQGHHTPTAGIIPVNSFPPPTHFSEMHLKTKKKLLAKTLTGDNICCLTPYPWQCHWRAVSVLTSSHWHAEPLPGNVFLHYVKVMRWKYTTLKVSGLVFLIDAHIMRLTLEDC